MPSDEDSTPEDPWLTLAEIAEELRMSPATIRSWVAGGTLSATRAGKRKWLVRRSEVDRLMAGKGLGGPDPAEPFTHQMDMINPPGRSPHWPPEAVQYVTKGGWLGLSESVWREALRVSAMAPPDDGFIERLERIADAAARKSAALANMEGEEPREWWENQAGLPNHALSYELRPGGNRPGPPELWEELDRMVMMLSRAMEKHHLEMERDTLERVSLILHEIIEALDDEAEEAELDEDDGEDREDDGDDQDPGDDPESVQ